MSRPSNKRKSPPQEPGELISAEQGQATKKSLCLSRTIEITDTDSQEVSSAAEAEPTTRKRIMNMQGIIRAQGLYLIVRCWLGGPTGWRAGFERMLSIGNAFTDYKAAERATQTLSSLGTLASPHQLFGDDKFRLEDVRRSGGALEDVQPGNFVTVIMPRPLGNHRRSEFFPSPLDDLGREYRMIVTQVLHE
jgi:hypothetical protein